MDKTLINENFKIPSNVIISGEHSCVYGEPLLVVNIPLYIEVEFKVTERLSPLVNNLIYKSEKYGDFELDTEDKANYQVDNVFLYFFDKILIFLGVRDQAKNFKFTYNYTKNVPDGLGLGSSAAFILSIYNTLLEFAKKNRNDLKIDKQKEFELLRNLECKFHGKSSGLDILALQQKGLKFF